MLYSNFTITVAQRGEAGYPATAIADGVGRASAVLAHPDAGLMASAARTEKAQEALQSTGSALFRWLMSGDLEMLLRIAWDRAVRLGRGLRIRLSFDAPEVSAWPWELLYDAARDHWFAVSISTLLVRYFDQTGHFGALTDQKADLPLSLILVLPATRRLSLASERAVIEQATSSLGDLLKLRVLDGSVTRSTLADALLAGRYDVAHFSGHGGFADGEGYVGLSGTEGGVDWVSGPALSQLLANHPSLKLVVLNACSTGRTDAGQAFRGLAPNLVKRGISAVIAMQNPLTDQAATIFAREFYCQLCAGENAGQADVAVTHARNMLAVLLPDDPSWAAPVLFTHAAAGAVFTRDGELPQQAETYASAARARHAALLRSLQTSMDFDEDWALADQAELERWRGVLRQAELSYQSHLDDARAEARETARYGAALVRGRLTALEEALKEV